MTETFYDVLGVDSDASKSEIEAAYREQLKRHHPDVSDAADAKAATKRVIRAKEVLTNETERRRYDRIGHHAYTRRTESTVDETDVSSAAAAARNAGWGSDQRRSDSDSNERTRTNPRHRPGERRRRERRANRNVSTDPSSGPTGRSDPGSRHEGSRTSRTATGDVTGGQRSAYHTGGTGESPAWSGQTGYSVRQQHDTGGHGLGLFETAQSRTLLAITFVLYPVILFSSIFPPFPLVFKLIVGICAIFLVGYMQTTPEVGIVVFGFWSGVTVYIVVSTSLTVTGLIGVMALTGTIVPFGLSVLTFWAMNA